MLHGVLYCTTNQQFISTRQYKYYKDEKIYFIYLNENSTFYNIFLLKCNLNVSWYSFWYGFNKQYLVELT